MLADITLGQYYPGTSFVHKLDPRTKILATMAVAMLTSLLPLILYFISQRFILNTFMQSGVKG